MTADDSGLTAALLTLTQHAERLGQLETGVAANLQQCEIATEGLAGAIADLRTLVEQQGQLIEALSQLVADARAAGRRRRARLQATAAGPLVEDQGRRAGTRPSITWPRWVEQVYRPHYGHLATGLGTCWQDHPLCLVGLDIVSELHSVLYFQPKRTASMLSAQAEYTTRILPAFAEQFRTETSKCTHRPEAASGSAWRGAR